MIVVGRHTIGIPDVRRVGETKFVRIRTGDRMTLDLRPIAVFALVLSACSAASTPPSANPTPTPSGVTATATATSPATPQPTPSPTPTQASVALAPVEVRPLPTRAPGSDCSSGGEAPGSLDRAMSLDGTRLEIIFQSGGPRDGGAGGWSDGVPGPTIRFDAETAQKIEATADTVARLLSNKSVSLIEGQLELYRLDSADRAGQDAEPVARAELAGDAEGLDVPLPVERGRWLLSVYLHWQTDCSAGDGYADLLLVT